jgi:hypothetical protein
VTLEPSEGVGVMRSRGFALALSVMVASALLPSIAAAAAPAGSRMFAVSQLPCPVGAVGLATDGTSRMCRWISESRAVEVSVPHKDCTIEGTEGADVLKGTGGRDVICGYGGDDVIKALAGRDIVYGGAGKDRIRGGPGFDSLYGEDGNDRIFGGRQRDDIFGQMGNDRLFGQGWRDYLAGGYGDDAIYGGTGGDYAYDSAGNDVFYMGAGADTAQAWRGIDAIYAGPGRDTCLSVWDESPGDLIDGGEGANDQYDADVGDIAINVEIGPEACGC